MSAAALARACAHLEADRPDEAVRALAGVPETLATRAIRWVATGDMEAAYDAAVPFPALLRRLGQHFLARGERHAAFHCFAQLQTYEPGAMPESLASATPAPLDEAVAAHLDADRPHDALRALDGETGAAAQAARHLALARIEERALAPQNAARHARAAFDLGLPHPALLRAAIARLQAVGDLRRAHECAVRLQPSDPTALPAFLGSLDGHALSRLAPHVLDRARRPGVWSLWRMKRALVDRIGVDAAGLAYLYAGPHPHLGEVRTLPIAPLEAAPHDVLFESRPVHLPAPRLHGRPDGPGLEARGRTLLVARVPDAVVASKSNFVLQEDRALLDFQRDELERVPVQWEVDAPLLACDGRHATFAVDGTAAASPPLPRALTLVGANTKNFGHWLLEFLPALWMCRGRDGFAGMPLLVDADMPPQHVEALRMFAGDDHPLVVLQPGDAVRVDDLWTCSRIMYHPIAPALGSAPSEDIKAWDTEAVGELLKAIEPDLPEPGDGPRRLFLARRDGQHRHMVNRAAVEAFFAEHGFAIVDFGTLSFTEQLRLVRGADMVVGPDGSSLLITMLARPGLRIGVFNNPFMQDYECWAAICAHLRQPLLYLIGEVVGEPAMYPYHADYRIATDRLPGFLEELERA